MTDTTIYDTDPDQFLATMPENDPDLDNLVKELEDETPSEDIEPIEQVADVPVIKPKRVKNYINNADMLIQLEISVAQDQMTDELVRMLQTLCTRYGSKINFGGYSYIEDMKAYAMYMLVRTWRAFNPQKGKNPFAFFTQCIKHSFIQFLNKEQNERDIRDQMLVDAGFNPSYSFGDDDGGIRNSDDY
jgi:hypothetical protein